MCIRDSYETISEAVAEANDNDTIQIYSGTYKETLVLDKPLTLIGKGDVTLTFDGDTVFTSQAAIAGETTPYAGIVTATADVALKNITIKGNPEAANNNGMLSHTHRYAGVVALDANVTRCV